LEKLPSWIFIFITVFLEGSDIIGALIITLLKKKSEDGNVII
jgi:hypothetical protein